MVAVLRRGSLRPRLSTWLAILTLLLCPALPGRGEIAGPRPPNVVFILVDDLGWADLAVAGNEFHKTPQIDSLAQRGMFFTRAYASAPNCSPSRASIVTGQHPARHGIVTVGSPNKRKNRDSRKVDAVGNRSRLDVKMVGLFGRFRAAGYSTACIGKWHLAPAGDPAQMGCDLAVDRSALGYEPAAHARQVESPQGIETEYLVDRLTDEALRFIDDHRAGPFFLYLSHYSVHVPFDAKPDKVAEYEAIPGQTDPRLAIYAAMVESVDDGVGRIVRRLAQLDLADDTIVVFTSDNGAAPAVSSRSRGGKGTLFEGGIRVPLIVLWPGHVATGSTSDLPVLGMDIYPTLLDMAGLRRPDAQVFDGMSLLPVLEGREQLAREAIFWHVPAYTHFSHPASAIQKGGWKLIEYLDDGRLELFDLEHDPVERTDRAGSEPARVAEMRTMLDEWRAEIGAPMPTPRVEVPGSAAAPGPAVAGDP